MHPLIGELVGTFFLLLLGTGVVANVLLNKTKASSQTQWLIITCAWGLAVFVGVYISAPSSGAHINPAITLALAIAGKFSWSLVPGYLLSQLLGAMAGSWVAYLVYIEHYRITDNENIVRGSFCTAPAIRHKVNNLFSELVGTFVLVIGVLFIAGPSMTISDAQVTNFGLGSLDALPVALLVWVIGMALGGTTGYAINPARDFGPRLVYQLIPRKNKSADWNYSWIPILGPLLGGLVGALTYLAMTL
ncbi:MAG: aquaporin family protein [Flavobacteriaceae bacterium]|nr:aquaporin family protein [Flavobacteriaceae bacterium]MCY4266536.1 aquaporin family protein [Flavobacteriaceae bacterium]MCY4299836.1 aquaporin family protein [Flavobacteriaceae bacterium]